jgi:hypothetical protein
MQDTSSHILFRALYRLKPFLAPMKVNVAHFG